MLALWILAACTDEKGDSGETAPPLNQGDDTAPVVCDGTAPVIDNLVVEAYDGLYPFETGDAPALTVSAESSDADGDIDRMNLILWWDDVVDGTVDTSGTGTEAGYYQFSQDPCEGFSNNYGLIFEVDGNRFAFGTEYEFAGVVWDDAGLVSEVAIGSGTTPSE